MFNIYNVANKLAGERLPSYFGYSYVCMGTGTRSYLQGGELLIIKRGYPKTMNEGDRIVFNFANDIAVSTILYKFEGGYVTQNDAGEPNAALEYDDVLGKVVGVVPAFGNLLIFMVSEEFNILISSLLCIVIWAHIVVLNISIRKDMMKLERIEMYKHLLREEELKRMSAY